MNPILSGLTWWVDFTNVSSLIIGGGTGVAILKATNLANTGLYFSGVPGNYTQSNSSGFVSSYATYNTAVSSPGFGLTNELGDYGSYQDYTSWFMVNNQTGPLDIIISSDNEQNYLTQQQGYRWFSVDAFPSSTDIRTYTFYTDATSVSPEPVATGSTNTWYVGAVRTYQSGLNATTELWINGVLISATTQTKTLITAVNPIFKLVGTNTTTQKITETFFYDRKLSDTEMSDNFAYFNQKYYGIGPITPTPTPTITSTPTNTTTNTSTPTNTPSPTATPGLQPTPTPTPTPTSHQINFKTLHDDFNLMASKHKQINSFGLGDVEQISFWTEQRMKELNTTFNSPVYPLLYVVPSNVINELRYKTWNFNVLSMDIAEASFFNQVDTVSDTLQILQDVISQYRLSVDANQGNYYNKYFIDDTITCIPFLEKYVDMTNGWNAEFKIQTMTPLDRCSAAYNEFTGTPIVHLAGINYKTFHDDFRLLADYHKQLNSFGFGPYQDISFWTEGRLKEENTSFNSPVFPLMYVVPNNVEQKLNYMTYKFTIIVMDIIERDLTNQVDVLSDTLQIMDDIIGQFRLSVEQSLGNFNELYYLQDPVNCMPFLEKFTDLCGGWSAQLSIDVMTPLNRCDAAFESFITPTATQTPTQTNTPSPTSSETPTPTQTETPTNTPTPTSSETPTPTPTITSTQTQTPTNTETPTQTPTCGTYTTQYLEVNLGGCSNFQLTLWEDPNFTNPANALCDYVVSGCAYGDQGTVYCGTETIANNDHNHNFNLNPVLQPGECVSGFTVNSVVPACPCVNVVFNQTTPTPTPTLTQTPTPSGGGGGNKLWDTNTTNWDSETGLWNTV